MDAAFVWKLAGKANLIYALREISMIRTVLAICLFFLAAGTATSLAADSDANQIPGIGPVGEVVRLHTGFKFTEGPADDAYGNVYFRLIRLMRAWSGEGRGFSV